MSLFRTTALAAFLGALALPAAAQVPGENFLAQWDADGDGTVTLTEATERRADLFAAYDADENGILDAAERAEMNTAGAEMRAAMQEGRGPGKGMGNGQRQGQGHGQGHGQGERGHDRQDMGGDGAMSLADFTKATDAWFARRDRNGDGAISAADFGPRN